jgi:hypothetical protein
MPQDPFIREKFTRLRQAAKKLAAEYFERFQKHRYQTEIGSWRHLQSDNIEFIMKRSANRSTPTITCKKAQVDALHCRKDHAGLPRPQVPTQCVYQDAAGGGGLRHSFSNHFARMAKNASATGTCLYGTRGIHSKMPQ